MSTLQHVPAAFAQALADKGYTALTPVQEAVLDPALNGADVLVSAQTGSGKTVAFGLAMAQGLLDGADRFGPAAAPLALIIAPTRELALQVHRELQWLYGPTGASFASCVGGMDMRTERRNLDRGAHIVVGTPGRLKDHIERNSLDLSSLRVAVLDEADEMLDLGFREDLEFILGKAPADRRTMMFSATVPREIAALAKTYQRDAVRISAGAEREQHVDIEYRALAVDQADKENAIVNVLRFYEAKNALVFCGLRATVNHLTARLANRGFSVVALSGELSQAERTHSLQAMRDGRARVCVATDVAARGIDLPNLELVVHADLPQNKETLLHRSGRTGRAGRKGVSALIVPHKDRKKADRLLGGAGITAAWGSAPGADEVNRRDAERLLADPMFTGVPAENEADLVAKLLGAFDVNALAMGFVRQYMTTRSAPEDLRSSGADARAPVRLGPDNSFWVTLSVGAAAKAEPRWLLPMLCRSGDLTKNDIGSIRVQQDVTEVQLNEGVRARFLAALGSAMMLEDGIRVSLADGQPTTAAPDRPKPAFVRARSVEAEPVDAPPEPVATPVTTTYAPRPSAYSAPAELGEPAEAPRKPRHKDRPVMVERRPDRASDRTPERGADPMAEAVADGSVVPYAPKKAFNKDGPKPAYKPGAKPGPKPSGKPYEGNFKPRSAEKPGGKFEGKPAGKWIKRDGPPKAADGKPASKPYFAKPGKPGDKPAGKPFKKPKPHRGQS